MRTLILLWIWVFMMGVLAWHAHNLKKELDNAKLVIGTLSAGIESRDNAITRLQDEARQQADNERALRQSLSNASTLSLSREQRIQRLLNENKVLRDWFATALPAGVIRLHQRPTFANPNDYLRWLSDGDQLPAAGQQSGG
ncbi:Rz-like lysis system protein LysB [Yersinia enterocolitica]|uniref:Lysis regulatory protein n=1 Tax=Yersinia phage vB_YenM_201.16 TaxID=2918921 RepID=A0AAE9JWW2_9CAUD|nr:Rz-like lysis system protein LysB [Yersinia enterocolitica]YP_010664238.1 Rz-like spanin [Yersinia phage vB_YenM_201.16]EKN4118699.1 LysB family phage lysis regulatory protein [Yersinia enterocolitica]EKN4871906.1 LysB family phage lysis regulatory protein [Yersinia enterocolitica]EKN5102170.1 LysB family phage lysis regulatory protein [Yersinia enterocolitica]EKN6005653.1 LysB family phage lysis regulatory protein [Yersinia enterocolitica]EKN6127332.1 LysB family phage lysis regulatory pr